MALDKHYGLIKDFILKPLALGLAIAFVLLYFNPHLGQKFGDKIYTSRQEVLSYAKGIERSKDSVVNVYVSKLNHDYTAMDKDPNRFISSASGVIVSSDGYIITNYHVIPSLTEPNRSIWVQTNDGTISQALIVGFDRRTDIAVIKIHAQNLPAIPINDGYIPRVGDIVFAIGNPNNLGQTVTQGIISATARTGSGLLTREKMNIREGMQDLIQTDAAVNFGNSGGALINSNGDLVGINTASFNNVSYSGENIYGISFAIPTKLVLRVFNEILAHGRVIRGYLGISDENDDLIADNSNQGVNVKYIDPEGPAAATDLQVGDIIIGANNSKINNVRELIDVISNNSPGTVLNLKVNRQSRIIYIPVTLAEDKVGLD